MAMLRLLAMVLFPLVIAMGGGTASALYALDHFPGFDTIRAGPWFAYPATATRAADPYWRAQITRNSRIALGAAEGTRFKADRDSNGKPLNVACDYRIGGAEPAARLWTLFVSRGGKIAKKHDARNVQALHSREILRGNDGSIEIVASSRPQPGNWLAVSGTGNFDLVLTLYDSPAANRSAIKPLSFPQIRRLGCD